MELVDVYNSRRWLRHHTTWVESAEVELVRIREVLEIKQREHLALCKEAACCPACLKPSGVCLCVVMAGRSDEK